MRLTNLKTGDAHIANNIAPKDVASVKTDSTLTYQEVPGLSFGSLVPNRKEGFTFNEARYVKAVSMALDRQELLDKAFFGIGVVGYGTIAPAHFAFDANFKPYAKADAEGAKALVQAVALRSARSNSWCRRARSAARSGRRSSFRPSAGQRQISTPRSRSSSSPRSLKQQADHVFKGMTYVGWSGRVDPGHKHLRLSTTPPVRTTTELLHQTRMSTNCSTISGRRPTKPNAKTRCAKPSRFTPWTTHPTSGSVLGWLRC